MVPQIVIEVCFASCTLRFGGKQNMSRIQNKKHSRSFYSILFEIYLKLGFAGQRLVVRTALRKESCTPCIAPNEFQASIVHHLHRPQRVPG